MGEAEWKEIAKIAVNKFSPSQLFVGLVIAYVIHQLTKASSAALDALKGHNSNLMKALDEREARITALLDKFGAHKKKEDHK